MIRILTFLILGFTSLLSAADSKPNVLLICIDDLRPELKCFGADYIHSPHMDALASEGVAFHRHYVQAPTCGASRYTLMTGRYGGSSNGAIFSRAMQMVKSRKDVPPSMPAWFRQHGYTTVSVGKVTHHPGGRGGADWDDSSMLEMPDSWDRHLLQAGPWQHPRGWMHGLANGEIRKNAKDMDLFQAVEGQDSVYPDGLNTDEAVKQLQQLATDPADKPFFLAFGILRPHLPFGAPAKYLEPYQDLALPPTPHPNKPVGKTTWHGSGEFMKYQRWGRNPNKDAAFAMEVRRHYAACVSYADAQVGRILKQLDDLGERDNTIVVLWGDHGWHLGEHAIWGKHALFEESLRSPLIISHPAMPSAGKATQAIVETLDLFPTLADLAGLPVPEFAQGQSLRPMLESPSVAEGHPAISYSKKTRTVRTNSHRLISHKDGHVELYDHRTAAGETHNVARQQPEVVQAMLATLDQRLGRQEAPLIAYVGTYTSPLQNMRKTQVDLPPGNGQGIHLFHVDRKTGAMKPTGIVKMGTSPSALAFNEAKTYLYSANETERLGDNEAGSVTAFAINQRDGTLSELNSVNSGGKGPAHLSVHPSEKFVLVANYFGGSVAVLPIRTDGSLGEATDVEFDDGTIGPIKATNAPPGSFAVSGHDQTHAHMIESDLSGRRVIHSDLGLDQLLVWNFDSNSGQLTPNEPHTISLPPGDGPRHFYFHPNGRWFYSVQEEGSTVVLFDYDADQGRLTERQTISTLPKGYGGSSFGSEIMVSKDGKFVYAGNRLYDSVAIFSIHQATGKLTYQGDEWTRGNYPRSFNVDPSDTFFYVCNQRADNITTFRRNHNTGQLSFTGHFTPVGNPSIIVFKDLAK
jgi:iduronate 2-sulfatase